jgi:hypothetical protein
LGDFTLTAGRDSLVAIDSAGSAIMHDLTFMFADEDAPRARLTQLLEHFSELSDDREPGRIDLEIPIGVADQRDFAEPLAFRQE